MHVYLPKFTFTARQQLKGPLSALGIAAPFSDAANFSRITSEKAQKLQDIVHQAFVDVNEEGTEAAAVTGGIGGDAPSPVPQPITFRADHPFVFLILDKRTGAILFLGRVQNPRA
jgi:serpin B